MYGVLIRKTQNQPYEDCGMPSYVLHELARVFSHHVIWHAQQCIDFEEAAMIS